MKKVPAKTRSTTELRVNGAQKTSLVEAKLKTPLPAI